ncbi:MAG: hypothetical protein AAF651_02545 [Cyanobacteria bacterium P01_C01_bin.73]
MIEGRHFQCEVLWELIGPISLKPASPSFETAPFSLVHTMKYGAIPLIIPMLAIAYLLIVYGLISLAKLSGQHSKPEL